MNAIILSIGDELVLGQTVDTNSAWLSQQLAALGCAVKAHLTVGDDQHAIEQVMLESVGRCDALIVTGGIGPTEDDLTRQALAAVMKVPLELDTIWADRLEAFFRKLGRPMPETNRIQAMIPRGGSLIDNPNGTAAGIDVAYRSGDQKTICRVFVLPGVPKEMKAMFAGSVLPHIEGAGGGASILSRTLHTFGAGESSIAQKLGELMKRGRNPSVGTTVSQGIVSVRINASCPSCTETRDALDATIDACRAALGDLVFGVDDETLAAVVGAALAASGHTVTTAESCTGGLLAKMLTDVSGSSAYFTQGWITYANKAKYERLGVSMEVLNMYGAVSEPVVELMAKNARRLALADFGLAISGIAGPTGGSDSKPVGTVCIAVAHSANAAACGNTRYAETATITRRFVFPGDREMVRDAAAKMALTMLRFHLLNKPLPF
jgi:nicotinamide-nucleotide amidase